MTRGRRPLNAIDEAMEIAGRRWSVVKVTGKRDCAFDFIIIEPCRNVFVKVKRSQTSFTYPLEILHRCEREIACLHRVALTSVTARGIPGPVSHRDMAVLSDQARFRPGDPGRWLVYPS